MRTVGPPAATGDVPDLDVSLLRNLEFRTLTITQFFSLAGDQLARVALSRPRLQPDQLRALQAAIAYALTFVPAAIGGPLARRPRRPPAARDRS